ncbi:uroporphyrinogen-III synthase HEM4 NDAI_0E00840 [Naumovozyma dairenensis CBS 421]|uniref:Tetrapyrrole biosynthesis uroporphyrinogen III synthase domain-containing protein n=1 Tax=Naumovozyma dairenensis (strain ATCC 10597 / BCRC 20456 / CBS 421 / NBRC 0211 / NRRL Y-12639) TaxID=1071378 RepID=G0WAY0_NAUDC|nr:hypothetical protein NDAI_0E00840 [Naumovozyma dairenensis CBS 421]CCD24900.1 hypothetical protein NDAI_0E00840 [Naumovozyma dairenensis CBS 421]
MTTSKTVLLLKNKTEGNDRYDVLFKEKGYNPKFIPLIKHTHLPQELLHLIADESYLKNLRYIVVTSQRTVECINEQILPQLTDKQKQLLFDKVVYTVGPTTASYLERSGFKNIKGGHEAGNGDILSDIIVSDLSSNNKDNMHEILLLVGKIRRDIIPKKLNDNGFSIKEVIVYETDTLKDNCENFQATLEDNCWVVVFSPQGIDDILEYIKQNNILTNHKIQIAAIGPTTEKFLNQNGIYEMIVSPKPDAHSLLNEIERHSKHET